MFELDIQVKVALHTGAAVQLTDEQTRRIKNYATEVLLGAPDVKVQPTTTATPKAKKKHHSKWTADEDGILMEIVKRYSHIKKGVPSRARASDLRAVRKEHLKYRTQSSLTNRLNQLAEQYRKAEVTDASNWNPVVVRVS